MRAGPYQVASGFGALVGDGGQAAHDLQRSPSALESWQVRCTRAGRSACRELCEQEDVLGESQPDCQTTCVLAAPFTYAKDVWKLTAV